MTRTMAPTTPLVFLVACTLDAGHGFATLHEGALRVELHAHGGDAHAGDADDGPHAELHTDLGYEVELESLHVRVGEVVLAESVGGGGGASFDPADPPPGYSDCHGGHCHAADGSLPSYEEIEATLDGGELSLEPRVRLPVDRLLSVLEGGQAELATFRPSAELGEGSLDRAQVVLTRLELHAHVRGGELGEESLELEVGLPLELTLEHALAITLGRDGPRRLEPEVVIGLESTLLDSLDFAALAEGAASLRISEPSGEPARALQEALLGSELEVSLEGGMADGDHDDHDDHDDDHDHDGVQ